MDILREFYQRIDYLRAHGVKMKEIADWINLAPSALSSLYTTVLPNYITLLQTVPSEEALEQALLLVNNVSKRKLLGEVEDMFIKLKELEPETSVGFSENTFARQLFDEMHHSVSKTDNIEGIYMSYSLSSSADCLKAEPFIIISSACKGYVKIGRNSAHGDTQWGFGIVSDPQNMYCMFNEHEPPLFTPVTVYLQIPLFRHPKQLRGLYVGLDYNRIPVARRLLLVKETLDNNLDEFTVLKGRWIEKMDFTPEQQVYYDYTCQEGDYIKMCAIPSLQMDETDLIREKKMLAL